MPSLAPVARAFLPRLAAALGLFLSVGVVGCDSGAAAGKAEEAAKGKGDAQVEPAAEPEPEPEVEAAACSASIAVTGAETFETPELAPSVGVVDRKGEPWISVTANRISGKGPRYILTFFALRSLDGELSFHDEARGMNLLTLQMIGGPEFSASQTKKSGGDPGSFVMSKPREGWVEIHGKAKLTSDEGDELEVQLDMVRALPPAKCPKS